MSFVALPSGTAFKPPSVTTDNRIAQAPRFQGCTGHAPNRIRDTDRFYQAKPSSPLIQMFQWSVHHFLSRPLGFKLQMAPEDIQKLRQLESQPGGLILAPNHSSIADAFTLQELGYQTGVHPATMTALDSFDKKILKLPYQVIWPFLSRFGHFSVNPGNSSTRRSTDHAENLVENGTPLLIFPEGRFSWNNPIVSPCRNGTMRIALKAAQASQKPVQVVPIGIYYQYSEKARKRLEKTLSLQEKALEKQVGDKLPKLSETASPPERIERLIDGMLKQLEKQYGKPSVTSQIERIDAIENATLKRLIQKYNARQSETEEPFQQIRYLCQAVYQQQNKYPKPQRLRDRLNHWSKPYKNYEANRQETRQDIRTLKALEMLLLHKAAIQANPGLSSLNSQLDAVSRLSWIISGKSPNVWQIVRGCTARLKVGVPVEVRQPLEQTENRFIDRANQLTEQLKSQLQQAVTDAQKRNTAEKANTV